MTGHVPFDATTDWANPYCGNTSNDPLVDKLIGNAYHVVRTVYCNLGNLKLLYDYLTTHGMVVGVQSEAELKALPKQFAKFARIYNFASTGDRQVTDYLYVDDDASGIKPDDPTLTGSWIKVAVSGSTGGGEGGGEGAYIPYVYQNGSATGGETSFKVPDGTVGVPFLIINGSVQYVGYGFTYAPATATVTLSNPLTQGDEVVALTTAVPANPDNPDIPGWVQVNWLYNNGSAVGGEQVITVPYSFKDVPAVYKNGLRLYKGLQSNSYVIDPDTHTITMTEILAQGDRVIVTLGGESETLTVTDRTLQEVARSSNVKDTDVVLSTTTNLVITGKKVIYDVVAQKSWGLPTLPPNAYIVKVEGDKLTYNPGNVTVTLLPSPGSQESIDLVKTDVANLSLVVARVFGNVSSMVAYDVKPGSAYQTLGYFGMGDSGGATYYVTAPAGTAPDGYGEFVASNGNYIRLLHTEPTDVIYGVVSDPVFVAATAWNNRQRVQSMLRNLRFNKSRIVTKEAWYLSSLYIERDNYELTIEPWVNMYSGYDDASIPESLTAQSGGFITIAKFFDADNGDFIPWRPTDTRVNQPISNVTVNLNGFITTVYKASHTNPNNNNAIGGFKCRNCRIVGTGGILGSDHRAVNWDGDDTYAHNMGGNSNCHIDLGIIQNVVDNCVHVVGDKNNAYESGPMVENNTVNVKRISTMLAGGYGDPQVVRVTNHVGTCEIDIGEYVGNSSLKPALLVTVNSSSVALKIGYVLNVSKLAYVQGTLDVDVEASYVYGTPIGIQRAVHTITPRHISLHGILATDSNFAIAYSSLATANQILKLSIYNNVFSYTPANFAFIALGTAGTGPVFEDIHDNPYPSTWTGTAVNQLNTITNGWLNLRAAAGLTTYALNLRPGGAFPYKTITVMITDGSVRRSVEIDVRTRQLTTGDVNFVMGASVLTTAISGNTLTLTLNTGTLQVVVLHN